LPRDLAAFVKDGSCGSSDRLRFDVILEPDTKYRVLAEWWPVDEFRTAAEEEFDDGTGCSVAPGGDAGSLSWSWLLLFGVVTLALSARRHAGR
jgi:MYXO-CTERM domain-containing protein